MLIFFPYFFLILCSLTDTFYQKMLTKGTLPKTRIFANCFIYTNAYIYFRSWFSVICYVAPMFLTFMFSWCSSKQKITYLISSLTSLFSSMISQVNAVAKEVNPKRWENKMFQKGCCMETEPNITRHWGLTRSMWINLFCINTKSGMDIGQVWKISNI